MKSGVYEVISDPVSSLFVATWVKNYLKGTLNEGWGNTTSIQVYKDVSVVIVGNFMLQKKQLLSMELGQGITGAAPSNTSSVTQGVCT